LSFGSWHLSFICHLPPCVSRACRTHKNKWQTDETNRMYFSNLIGRPTYEKELLNSGKNNHFYKTNHPGFPHALPPIRRNPTARTCPSAVQNPRAPYGSGPPQIRYYFLRIPKDMLRWVKWTSCCGVMSATSCSRNGHVSNKIHQGFAEEA